MTGVYRHSIDAKGRLFIPAKLREELGETFYVTIDVSDPCLTVYSEEAWEQMTKKFENLPYSKSRIVQRLIYGNAMKCEPDAQGRILLPQNLRGYAKLEKDVMVVGVSGRAEIWNAETWNKLETEELASENLAAIMEELGI